MRLLALLLAAPPLLGCINTDPAVFVVPTLSTPAATVTEAALGTSFSGSFNLDLHLGPRASGPSKVTLGEFSIEDAAQTTPIVSALKLTSTTTFPVTVELDSDVNADFTFGTGKGVVVSSVATQLCATAGVVISGTIQDSLMDTSTPTFSPVFHPSGCP